jgi:hypothetical protein
MPTNTNSTTLLEVTEPACAWCAGDGCKSVMQPAFCIDCVTAMLRGEDEARPDLYRPAPPRDEHPANPSACALTFPQARAKLANTAYRTLTHLDICTRLRGFGIALDPHATRRALAWALAWALLPGGLERAKGGR